MMIEAVSDALEICSRPISGQIPCRTNSSLEYRYKYSINTNQIQKEVSFFKYYTD